MPSASARSCMEVAWKPRSRKSPVATHRSSASRGRVKMGPPASRTVIADLRLAAHAVECRTSKRTFDWEPDSSRFPGGAQPVTRTAEHGRGGQKPRFALGGPQYDRPMWSLLYLVARTLVHLLGSAGQRDRDDGAKDLEILVLRHQLRVLQRTSGPPQAAGH